MKIPRQQHFHAFTLLEIMVAISLLGVIVIAIYTSWHAIMKGSKVALDVAAATQRERISMRTLEDSLLCTTMFGANATNYAFIADSENNFSSLSFVARLPRSFPRSGKFGDLSVRRLNFNVEEGRDSKKRLVLRQTPLLVEMDDDEKQTPLVLAKDVNKFILEYWDAKASDWATEWTTTNQLPQMVRITLGLGRLDQYSTEPQEEVYGVVAIPGQIVRRDWQVPAGFPGGGNNNSSGINLVQPGAH